MASEAIQQVAGNITEKIFSGVLWFGLIIIILAALGGTMYYFFIYKRKFDIDIKIISKRARDRDLILFDKAAILKDRKTKAKYLKLWNLKTELKLPTFNILQRTVRGDYLELLREGENSWFYLTPPTVTGKYGHKADGRIYPIANQTVKAIDPEMDYWTTKRKTMNKGMFDTSSPWMKLLPYIPYIMAGAITIFILYILMRYLPEILSQLKALTGELNRRNIAQITTEVFLPLFGINLFKRR